MSHSTIHTILTLVILALLWFIVDSPDFWTSDIATTTALVAMVILVIIWAAFLVREQPEDERDAMHMMHAGRYSYLAGVAVLAFALFVQGVAHTIDNWIIVALASMLITKLASRWYTDTYQ